jgi:hypothetical protein
MSDRGQVVAGANPVSPTKLRGGFRDSAAAFFMPYRHFKSPSERIAKSIGCHPRGVATGVPVEITGDADRRMAE